MFGSHFKIRNRYRRMSLATNCECETPLTTPRHTAGRNARLTYSQNRIPDREKCRGCIGRICSSRPTQLPVPFDEDWYLETPRGGVPKIVVVGSMVSTTLDLGKDWTCEQIAAIALVGLSPITRSQGPLGYNFSFQGDAVTCISTIGEASAVVDVCRSGSTEEESRWQLSPVRSDYHK